MEKSIMEQSNGKLIGFKKNNWGSRIQKFKSIREGPEKKTGKSLGKSWLLLELPYFDQIWGLELGLVSEIQYLQK